MNPPPPSASIIIATYNRAQVLGYAIRSVLQSSLQDFELIVVGDGCTDQTATLVASFVDPRIRFINLPENSGNQAAPNNAGLDIARGRYIFFLNHDDMYFTDHLSRSIAHLEATGADILFSPVVLLRQSGREAGPPDPRFDMIDLDGVASIGFDPRVFIIASSWAMRREAYVATGPWLTPEKTRLSPSQEWLFRASRKGRRIAYHPHASVLCIHGGTRRLSYVVDGTEHARAWSWVENAAGPGADLLHCIAINQGASLYRLTRRQGASNGEGPLRKVRDFAIDLSRHVGLHPVAVRRFLDGEGKGAWIARIRAFTSEAPELRSGDVLRAGEPSADAFLVSGWHFGESEGRWSARSAADIVFRLADDSPPVSVALAGRPRRVPGTARFLIDGSAAVEHRFTSVDETILVPIPPDLRQVRLTIVVDDAGSPLAEQVGSDQRTLGFWLSSLRLVPTTPGGALT